jgi:FkbM family methyltransferase
MSKADVISFLGRLPGISHCLRWYAGLYREGSVVTIGSGYAKGMLWRRHHRYVNGFWIGHYELPVQEAISRELREGQVFYDVGANAGFFSLLACRRIGPAGHCVSIDPDPANCRSIREQIELNHLDNWEVAQLAVGSECGRASFARERPGSSKGHLGSPHGDEVQIEVECTTFDNLLQRLPPPRFVKMDIEGAEGPALRGSARLLAEVRPAWLIELHGSSCADEVARILRAARYRFFDLSNQPLPETGPLPHHLLARPAEVASGGPKT